MLDIKVVKQVTQMQVTKYIANSHHTEFAHEWVKHVHFITVNSIVSWHNNNVLPYFSDATSN